jgi:D-3-phosphoglycerate dehydrogenase
MNRKTVLVNKPIHQDALRRLQDEVEALTPYQASHDELRALLPTVHGIILGGAFTMGPAELDLAVNLEILGRHGVGMDNVDIPAASQRRIPVAYTPYGPTESTAEHALLLIMAVARRLAQMDRAVRSGNFQIQNRLEVLGRELEGMTLGVVGFGRIGQRLAAMCRDALHMEIRVYDPYLDPETVVERGALPVSDLITLASQVDVLSVHTPFTPATHRLIDEEVIRALKPGAILVNTSRGPVVDEAALVEALRDGHLGGAGLDVFDPEPPEPGNPLLQFEQVVLTPHVGSFTHEGRRRMGMTIVDDVLSALRGKRPLYLANPDIWPDRRIKSVTPYTDSKEARR